MASFTLLPNDNGDKKISASRRLTYYDASYIPYLESVYDDPHYDEWMVEDTVNTMTLPHCSYLQTHMDRLKCSDEKFTD